MRITRIEIFGFKSFMDRLVLPIEAGVTGVVGPNGCGKSNIVDALRWVMGETRARNLRGGTLEDVIFNGTDKLRPLGLAEVTLTLRSTGDGFFADVVSPSLEAELAAEAEMKAAEDEISQEEEAGSGEQSDQSEEDEAPSGRPHLTVIDGKLGEEEGSSGEADEGSEVERSVPEDSEGSPEGAATPEEEARSDSEGDKESKISATLANRFSWLKSATEVQLTRRLYRSGESEFFINRVPCRLKDIKELFSAVGMGAKAHTIVAQGEVSRIVTAKPEQRRLILEEAAGVLGFREKIKAADRRLSDTAINISRVDDILKEVTRQVNSLRRQASRARNRRTLKERIAELELLLYREDVAAFTDRLAKVEKSIAELDGQEEAVGARLQKSQAEEEHARNELISVDLEGDRLRARIDSIKEEINNRVRERSERSARISELGAFVLARTTEIDRLGEREKTLREREIESSAESDRLAKREEELSEEIKSLNAADNSELREVASQLARLRESLKAEEVTLRKSRDELVRSQGRLEATEKQLIAASPLEQLRKTLGGNASEDLQKISSKTTQFARGLTVPEGLVDAVQSVLAERAEFLVAENPYEIAGTFVASALSGKSDNASGAALGVLKAGSAAKPVPPLSCEVPFPLLRSQIDVTPECERAADRILRGVYVAPSLEEAFAFFEDAEGDAGIESVVLVTAEGDLVTDYSFYSMRHDGGVLHLKNRVEELTAKCAELEDVDVVLKARCEEISSQIEVAEGEHSRILRETQERQAKARELSKEQGSLRGRLQSERRVRDQAASDLQGVSSQIDEARRRISEYEEEKARVNAELVALVPDEEGKLHEEVRNLNEQYLTLDEARREGRKTLSQLASQVSEVRRELDAVRNSGSGLSLDKQKVVLELEHTEQRVVEEYGEDGWLYAQGYDVALEQVIEEAFSRAVCAVGADEEESEEAGSHDSDAGDSAAPESVVAQQDEPEVGLVEDGLADEDEALQAESKELPPLLSAFERLAEIAIKDFRQEVGKLKARVQREGDVDPTSIERFEQESERLQTLTEQRADLDRAASTLKKTIERLRNTSEVRFMETFEAVSENFSKLIPRLFGGGKGRLELLDPDHPLESGVAIIARPPGKKLKSIDLLSGGEKAMCATALIIAMFIERPSPLCVLDEVDAPLDEANLVRFLSVVKEMSKKTQFIVITHNKGSMAVADKLVGVTMEQPGASKVLTVSLQEAYSQVA